MTYLGDAMLMAKVAIAFLRRARKVVVTRLEIMKTAYLVEREYYLVMRRRLTGLPYFNYVYGPYNGLVMDAVEILASSEESREYKKFVEDEIRGGKIKLLAVRDRI